MSKAEIRSWIAAAAPDDPDDDTDTAAEAQSGDGDSRTDWASLMSITRRSLLTSQTKVRIHFLNERLLPLASRGEIDLERAKDILQLLTFTYPRYVDSGSRDAVLNILRALVKRDEAHQDGEKDNAASKIGCLDLMVEWLSQEVERITSQSAMGSSALSNLFVLFTWCCALYETALEANLDLPLTATWPLLARSLAVLLDALLHVRPKSKTALVTSAIVQARRAVRLRHKAIPALVSTLVNKSKIWPSPLAAAPLLGLVVDVTLRLKIVPNNEYILQIKPEVASFYTTNILMSKILVPPHSVTAFNDFIAKIVTESEMTDSILPITEKAMLRSPEISLAVVSELLRAYQHPLTTDNAKHLLASALSNSKSANVIVRGNAVQVFQRLIRSKVPPEFYGLAVTEVLALPKSGKTASAEHRTALYTMLASIGPSPTLSPGIAEALPALLAKELNDAAAVALSPAFSDHLVASLCTGHALSTAAVSTVARELTSTKAATRRNFSLIIGNVFWALGELKENTEAWAPAAETLASAALPSLEANLKAITAAPLNTPAGPLEGYIATSLLLQKTAIKSFSGSSSKIPALQSIATTGTKPSFLLWDKVYQKLATFEEERWFLRAVESALFYFENELMKNEALRNQVGTCLLHLAADSSRYEIRRETLKAIQATNIHAPNLVNEVIRTAFENLLVRSPKATNLAADTESSHTPGHRAERLSAVLLACGTYSDSVDEDSRMTYVAKWLTIAHHADLCPKSRQLWIELAQAAHVDPHKLVTLKTDHLLEIVFHDSVAGPEQTTSLASAAGKAATTLAFVAPSIVVPRYIERIRTNLAPIQLQNIGPLESAIWKAPKDVAIVDVLANKKEALIERKGKNADIEKWEAELRKSLANKKPSSSTPMTKQDRALVDAQLAKEAQIRSKVSTVHQNLLAGLNLLRSLIAANVDEFRPYVWSMAALLLDGVLKRGSTLVGQLAVDTYVELGTSCSARLEGTRTWLSIATLRSSGITEIPDEMQVESLSGLVTRVLYRLRTLSEQEPFDIATFSYASPLLSHVVLSDNTKAGEEEEALERVALALDIIRFHVSRFSDLSFPRLVSIQNILHIIRGQPKLAKDAVSALVDAGEAIHQNATREEISVLIRATLAQEVYVRNACLQSLQPFDLTELDWSPELWMVCHDDDEQNSRLARHLWEDNAFDVSETFVEDLLPFLQHENRYARTSCAAAFGEAVTAIPQLTQKVLESLKEEYRSKAKILAPKYNEYGMLIEQSIERLDSSVVRMSVANTFQQLAVSLQEQQIVPFFDFLVSEEALGDRSSDVRREMLDAGMAVIDQHGQHRLAHLITMFETHLSQPSTSETSDYVNEAVVILFGRLARHLDPSDERIPAVVGRLVEALKTPSEVVQNAVADCLPPLIRVLKDSTQPLVDQLLTDLFGAPKYAHRRGAAYGLAGIVRGRGISALKEFSIISRIREAIDDKKQFEARQGALFALETFSATLGRLFEPYIIQLIPLLLTAFGDQTSDVRGATQDASKVIMANMSGYGIKRILPSLLSSLDEKQWRTKKGSIELLGTMAFCAPKQLSLSLPTVVPRLTSVLTDSHAQVRTAANKSLKQFGEVISNPEIQSIVPALLKALVDPEKTPSALAALLKKSFVHYIDSPSLALVIPILERGLKERGSETKRKAAQIVGNMASLTDSKDFVPYLPRLIPLVHFVLVDPVPEARATAAKALGTLIERLGETNFPDLVSSLIQTLKSDASTIDRQGAAQGLSEVLSGLGMERMEGLLPDVITNAGSPRANVREGFMSLLVYLPATFGNRFTPHLARIIPSILNGLADTEEFVRAASMKAGRMIVVNYSSKAIDLLLPELERGMFDSGWRIRQSSVTLIGELLYKVSGISGKVEIEEDEQENADPAMAETSRRALTEVLGKERRDRVLAALYLVRQDVVHVVRQSSIHIWKVLVHNTPRTVREILPTITTQIVELLASSEPEQRETAARTMADLCRKAGDKILGEIVPILRAGASSPNSRTREGVSLALREVVENTQDLQLEIFEDEIIAAVRIGLVDDSPRVRIAAAAAFDSLQEHVGAKAVDQTIPTLLEALRHPGAGSGTALQALREIMTVRASSVFPILIPTLIASPITIFNARALAALVKVAGQALSKRLVQLLTALAKALETEKNEEVKAEINETVRALVGSISDDEGISALMSLLLGWSKHHSPTRRIQAMNFFAMFCETSDLDFSLYRIDWIRRLVILLDDENTAVVEAAWKALDEFVKSVDKEEMEALVIPLRRTIEVMGGHGRTVPGFSLPKGIAPLLPIVIAGLTTGSNEQREHAAYAIADLVDKTEESVLKPYTTQLTGPLIRVITQATTYPPPVKSAILLALTTMLLRVPLFVKPFFPQLQRTFVKSLSDASLTVRTRAATALGALMKSQARVDPLIVELIGGIRSNEDDVSASFGVALANVVKSASANLGAGGRGSIMELLSESLRTDRDENYYAGVAHVCVGMTVFADIFGPFLQQMLATTRPHAFNSHSLLRLIEDAPDYLYSTNQMPQVVRQVVLCIGADDITTSRPAREAKELLKTTPPFVDDEGLQNLF